MVKVAKIPIRNLIASCHYHVPPFCSAAKPTPAGWTSCIWSLLPRSVTTSCSSCLWSCKASPVPHQCSNSSLLATCVYLITNVGMGCSPEKTMNRWIRRESSRKSENLFNPTRLPDAPWCRSSRVFSKSWPNWRMYEVQVEDNMFITAWVSWRVGPQATAEEEEHHTGSRKKAGLSTDTTRGTRLGNRRKRSWRARPCSTVEGQVRVIYLCRPAS